MLKSFIQTAFRSLRKHPLFSFLNVAGLSLAIAVVILITVYIRIEESYDDFHKDKDRIYRVALEFKRNGVVDFTSASNYPRVGPALHEEFPEVENYCRLFRKYQGGIVTVDDKSFREENLFYGDSTFFDIFSFPVISGSRIAFNSPHTAFVEQNIARKYFGDDNPIGKRISVGSAAGIEEFEITGVFQNPKNSHLKLNFLFSYPSLIPLYGQSANDSWGWYDFYTYIKVKEGTDPARLTDKFPAFADKHGGETIGSKRIRFFLQPVDEIHLHSHLMLEASANGDAALNQFLLYLALAVLLVAWINYVNLTTARSAERLKEIGIRQVSGSTRMQLVLQFLAESFFMNGVALLLSLALVALSLPLFTRLTGVELTLEIFRNTDFWIIVWSLCLLSALFAGGYPALVSSAVRPLAALKGIKKSSRTGIALRQALVVGQFIASVTLISGTLVSFRQITFMQSEELGVDINGIVVVRTPDVVTDQKQYSHLLNSYRNELMKSHRISNVTVTSEIPGRKVGWYAGSRLLSQDAAERTTIFMMSVDPYYLQTYDINLLAGRDFNQNIATENTRVLINKKAMETLGIAEANHAIGLRLRLGGDTVSIIGVVDNYHHESLKENFRPTVYRSFIPAEMQYVSLKFSGGDYQAVIKEAKEKYAQLFPGIPFEYFFLDAFYKQQYQQDERFLVSFQILGGLALVIALLGLFGLASYTVTQRKKEVGVRKVLGSSEGKLVILLSKDFVKLVLMANIIAIPVTLLIMERWLNNFAFRISFPVEVFIWAGLTSLAMAIAVVSYHTLSAARTNPVNVLKYE